MFRKLKNYSEEEVIAIIENIARQTARRFLFRGVELDDLVQECYIFAAKMLDQYDEEKPLENYLSRSFHNRLFNYKRDHIGNKSKHEHMYSPPQLSTDDECFYLALENDVFDCREKCERAFTGEERELYLKYINNVYMSKEDTDFIIIRIKEVCQ